MSLDESPTKRCFQITRSPLVFWLGLFGVLFLLWSWLDSMMGMAGIGRLVQIRDLHPPKYPASPYHPHYMAFYGHSGGCLKATVPICSSTTDLRVETVKYEILNSSDIPLDAEWFPMPAIRREKAWPFPSGANYVGTTYLFPHWVLLIIYFSIWAGVMDWSNRQRRRAARAYQRLTP